MDKHITVVAALKIGFGVLGLLAAIIVFVVIVGAGRISEDSTAIPITDVVGSVAAAFIILVSLPGIIGGLGLLWGKPWARILVLVLAVFDLLNIPIGTAIGAYTIWVLMQDETEQLLVPG